MAKNHILKLMFCRKLRPHPNCVSLLGACTNPIYPLCIVTEFIEDGDLETLLRHSGQRFSVRDILSMMKDVVSGMVHLHSEDILHCDLACRNLLVTDKTFLNLGLGATKIEQTIYSQDFRFRIIEK